MALPSIGVRIGLLGGKEYVEDLRRVVQETKTLKEEFKKVSEIEEPFSKASEQIDTLTRSIAKQEEKIRLFNDQLQRSAEKYGEHNSKTEKWRTEIAKAETELAKLKKQLEDLSVQKVTIGGLGELKRDLGTLEQAVRTVKSEFDLLSKQEGVFGSFGRAAGMKTALQTEVAAQKEVVSLLKDEYKKVADAQGEFSEGALKMKENVNKATASLEDMERQLSELPNGLELAGQEMQKVGDKYKAIGTEWSSAGRTLLPLSGAIAGGFVASSKAAVDFESDFNGVKKTIDASEKEFAALRDWIMEYSRTVGVSKTDIAGVMQIVGQLGVRGVENIEAFTEVAIEMGEATDWTEAEAADAMARFMNIYATPKEKVRDLANVIVALANNIATTEPEIGAMAVRMASAGAQAGLTEEQVLGLAASMSAVGIEAAAGGSSMSKILVTIAKTVEAAGTILDENGEYTQKLELLAEIAGMTADEFKRAWSEDTIGTLLLFIENLDNMERTGQSALLTIDELGMSEIRVSNALRALTLSSDEVARAQKIANQEVSNGSALTDEATIRWGEYSHRIEAAKQGIQNVGITIGERLLPYIERGIDFVQRMVDKWDALPPSMQETIIKTAALTATVGPLMMGIGGIFNGIGSIINVGGHLMSGAGKILHLIKGSGGVVTSLKATKDGMDAATGAAGLLSGAKGIGSIIATAGPYIAATGLIIGAGVLVVKNWDEIKEAAKVLGERIKEKWKNIKEWTSQTWDSLKGTVSKGWNTISDLTGGALKNIGDKVSETVRNALKWGKDFISNLGNGIKNGIEWVGNTSRSVGQRIKDFLGHSTPKEGPLADDDKWMPDMMQNFIFGIRNGIPGIENSVSGIGSIIHNGIMGGVKDLQHNLWQTLTYAYETVGNMTPGFESAAWKIGDGMRSKFSEIIRDAKKWGADIMSNLANSIQSNMSRVTDKIKGVAQTIKNYVGFSEPDKGPLSNFHTYMPDMMKLMAQGINEGLPMVKDAVQHTAYALLPQAYADLPTAAGSTYQTNMGGVTIQVYAQPGQDINELADVIEDRLVALEERRMYAYG